MVLIFTYLNLNKDSSDKIFKKEIKLEIDKKIKDEKRTGTIFYDIKYTGIDLSGNRYILRAAEAESSENEEGLLKLKSVEATFYFKNDKMLNITSKNGFYNNKTLDMILIYILYIPIK